MADSGDVDSSIIKLTQTTLGKYVKKPTLSEKLLKKPPFRFLHDVFNVVIRDTELTTNVNLTVRTSKIVAGLEPEKTNELLQLMGEIIEKQLDWKSVVEQMNGIGEGIKIVESKKNNNVADKSKGHKSKTKSQEKDIKIKEEKSNKIKTSTKGLSKQSTKAEKKDIVEEAKVKTKQLTKQSSKEKIKSKEAVKTKEKILKTKTESIDPVESKGSENEQIIEKRKILEKEQQSKERIKSKETSKAKEKISKNKKDTEEARRSSKDSESEQLIEEKPKIIEKEPKQPKERIKSKETIKVKEKIPKTKMDNEETARSKVSENEQLIEKVKILEKVDSKEKMEKLSAKVFETDIIREIEKVEKSTDTKMTSNQEILKSKLKIETNKDEEKILTKEVEKDSSISEEKLIESKISEKRKRSANKIQLNNGNQKDLKQSDQLTTLKNREPIAMQKEEEKLQKVDHPSSPSKSMTNTEVKRQTTFTRENSKDSNRPRTSSLRPPSARPPSARPGAPRRRDKNIEIVLQPNDQIKLAGVNIKLETFGDLDDDGENLVIIENPDTHIIEQGLIGGFGETRTENDDDEQVNEASQQGHLVQQILETQKELVQQDTTTGTKGMEKNEKDTANNLMLKQQTTTRHMNNLRDVIQNLTKSINPLGKLMDFIPEDIDAMQLEYTMWHDSYIQAANELKKEKSLTESSTEPMKNQLIQIEANITEYQEIIDISRVKILQNSEKIFKLLTTQH
uniref:TRAF3-interacting protein 1 N-terminal domain-containing protein n=1 Tax=Glossina brevipalpis TaxID=37001 RepID=A0A1A9WNI0_9MUSC